MTEAILSLGSNMGDRKLNLDLAIESLKNIPHLDVIKISSYYETEPFGVPDSQEKYFNCCVKVSTKLEPFALLGVCLGIESALGRRRTYRFSPRTIDIDIIFYGDMKINEKHLIIPHPRFHERDFVLTPLKEICPNGYFKNFPFENNSLKPKE